jgi:DNA polymerase alpha subunit p180 N terminal
MDEGGRARRSGKASRASKAKSALQELAELRRSGVKRAAHFEVREEEAVFDEVDEDSYAKLVSKRREEGGACMMDTGLSGHETPVHRPTFPLLAPSALLLASAPVER